LPPDGLRLRKKVVAKEAIYTPGARLGKRGESQMGFVSRKTAGFGIVSRQYSREERSKTRGGFHQEVDLNASIADAVRPGMTREATVRLVAPLEQMEHQDNQMGPELATFRCPQGDDLVDKVDDIESIKLPRLEARGLLLRPGIKVLGV
jgi:hypothetical protein